jgi:hypothetical protein
MVPKTLAAAIRKWPSTDLAELLGLIHTEIHSRAEHQRDRDKRSKSKRVASRSEK